MAEQLFDNTTTQRREIHDGDTWIASIDVDRLKLLADPTSGYGSDWLRQRWKPEHPFGHYPDRKED